MIRSLVHIVVALAFVVSAFGVSSACGDKFLVVGRGVKPMRLNLAMRPGSILIYEHKGAEPGDAAADPDLQATLVKAGHKVAVAEDTDTLESDLRTGKYDIIVATLSDALNLKQEAANAPSKPLVVPVLYNPTATAFSEAKAAFQFVLRTPGKTSQLLAAIDEALGQR